MTVNPCERCGIMSDEVRARAIKGTEDCDGIPQLEDLCPRCFNGTGSAI